MFNSWESGDTLGNEKNIIIFYLLSRNGLLCLFPEILTGNQFHYPTLTQAKEQEDSGNKIGSNRILLRMNRNDGFPIESIIYYIFFNETSVVNVA